MGGESSYIVATFSPLRQMALYIVDEFTDLVIAASGTNEVLASTAGARGEILRKFPRASWGNFGCFLQLTAISGGGTLQATVQARGQTQNRTLFQLSGVTSAGLYRVPGTGIGNIQNGVTVTPGRNLYLETGGANPITISGKVILLVSDAQGTYELIKEFDVNATTNYFGTGLDRPLPAGVFKYGAALVEVDAIGAGDTWEFNFGISVTQDGNTLRGYLAATGITAVGAFEMLPQSPFTTAGVMMFLDFPWLRANRTAAGASPRIAGRVFLAVADVDSEMRHVIKNQTTAITADFIPDGSLDVPVVGGIGGMQTFWRLSALSGTWTITSWADAAKTIKLGENAGITSNSSNILAPHVDFDSAIEGSLIPKVITLTNTAGATPSATLNIWQGYKGFRKPIQLFSFDRTTSTTLQVGSLSPTKENQIFEAGTYFVDVTAVGAGDDWSVIVDRNKIGDAGAASVLAQKTGITATGFFRCVPSGGLTDGRHAARTTNVVVINRNVAGASPQIVGSVWWTPAGLTGQKAPWLIDNQTYVITTDVPIDLDVPISRHSFRRYALWVYVTGISGTWSLTAWADAAKTIKIAELTGQTTNGVKLLSKLNFVQNREANPRPKIFTFTNTAGATPAITATVEEVGIR